MTATDQHEAPSGFDQAADSVHDFIDAWIDAFGLIDAEGRPLPLDFSQRTTR